MKNILIVDNEEVIRLAIRMVIAQFPATSTEDQWHTMEADCGEKALKLAERHNFDIILMDLSMQGLSGMDTTKALLKKKPDTRIIVVSMHNRGSVINALRQLGVCGYVLKDQLYKELKTAIEAVTDGNRYFSSEVIKDRDFRHTRAGASPIK